MPAIHDADLSPDRCNELEAFAADIANLLERGQVPLTFICTHNCRRSHLAQIWAQLAADEAGLGDIRTYSGGTEVTALHPNVAEALRRAGLEVLRLDEGDNPVYEIQAPDSRATQRCFSKVHDDPENPGEDFVAVLTCSSAASECPRVDGAVLRRELLYEDPKRFDGTPREASAYDECCAKIRREMRALFRRVAELSG